MASVAPWSLPERYLLEGCRGFVEDGRYDLVSTLFYVNGYCRLAQEIESVAREVFAARKAVVPTVLPQQVVVSSAATIKKPVCDLSKAGAATASVDDEEISSDDGREDTPPPPSRPAPSRKKLGKQKAPRQRRSTSILWTHEQESLVFQARSLLKDKKPHSWPIIHAVFRQRYGSTVDLRRFRNAGNALAKKKAWRKKRTLSAEEVKIKRLVEAVSLHWKQTSNRGVTHTYTDEQNVYLIAKVRALDANPAVGGLERLSEAFNTKYRVTVSSSAIRGRVRMLRAKEQI